MKTGLFLPAPFIPQPFSFFLGFRPLPQPSPLDTSAREYGTLMNARDLKLSEFQKHVSDRYEAADRARGTPKTWMWFSEEVGELARALARGKDRANLEEEFADVLAWLCTLANINDVDLAAALARKYLSERPPEGTK